MFGGASIPVGPHSVIRFSRLSQRFTEVGGAGVTENPRVGGSIPPLATILLGGSSPLARVDGGLARHLR
jgi:hypothetical protein